ncbi:MAG: nitroreductase family protein [candidate division WOR-3 bacterium]
MYGKVIDPERRKIALALEKFINLRRTIRSYLPEPVPREVAEKIAISGLRAPTKNNQIKWRLLLIDQSSAKRGEFIRRLMASYSYLSDIRALYQEGYLDLERYQSFTRSFMKGLGTIPLFAVMVAEKPPSSLPNALYTREMAHTLASCGFAAENMLLTALAWGLGGGILTLVSDEAERGLLELMGFSPENHTIAMVLTFGYPAEVPQRPPRELEFKWL